LLVHPEVNGQRYFDQNARLSGACFPFGVRVVGEGTINGLGSRGDGGPIGPGGPKFGQELLS
jgi:hypothetical protein